MIDWLRRETADPVVEVAGRSLPIVLRRHPTARRLTMRLAPDGNTVRITMPRWGRTAEALEFARSRADWLASQLADHPGQESVGHGTRIAFCGEAVEISWHPDAARSPILHDGILRLGGPEAAIARRVQRWLENEAISLMQADFAHYCNEAGLAARDLRLSRAQRRWGSCSADGTVRINWRLVQAPEFVRRSVVAHEVAHLVHFDHSPAFHGLLERIFEHDIAEANRWLKREGRDLYRHFG